MHTDACIGPHPAHVFIQYHVHTDRSKREVEGEDPVEKDQTERRAKSKQGQLQLCVAVVRRVY